MSKKIETGLIVVKDDIFSKIKRNIFVLLFNKEAQLLDMLADIERPRNKINGNIIIPKEIKKGYSSQIKMQ